MRFRPWGYRQTIAAYPTNGRSYVVAKENLGPSAGLIAGCCIDDRLSSRCGSRYLGCVGALTSVIPELHSYTLPLCLSILTVLTIANLNGTISRLTMHGASNHGERNLR